MNTQNYVNDSQRLREKIANSDLPVLLYFYSAGCGPSRLMNSILERIKNEISLEIVKVDSEVCSDFADQYHVHALPALLLFKDGELLARFESESNDFLKSADKLIQELQRLV